MKINTPLSGAQQSQASAISSQLNGIRRSGASPDIHHLTKENVGRGARPTGDCAIHKFLNLVPLNSQFDDSFYKLTGDEYYRQHQDHLRKSELEFQSRAAGEGTSPLVSTAYNPMDSNEKQQKQQVEVRPLFNDQDLKVTTTLKPFCPILSTSFSLPNANPAIPSTAKALFNLPLSDSREDLSSIPIKEQEAQKSVLEARANVIKKHHLFADQQTIELTLNTKDLQKHEAKDLVTTIKQYLKQKRLKLKQLIINGELHD